MFATPVRIYGGSNAVIWPKLTSVGYDGETTSDPNLAKWETTMLTSKIAPQEGA